MLFFFSSWLSKTPEGCLALMTLGFAVFYTPVFVYKVVESKKAESKLLLRFSDIKDELHAVKLKKATPPKDPERYEYMGEASDILFPALSFVLGLPLVYLVELIFRNADFDFISFFLFWPCLVSYTVMCVLFFEKRKQRNRFTEQIEELAKQIDELAQEIPHDGDTKESNDR
jgi:hypothetical protein